MYIYLYDFYNTSKYLKKLIKYLSNYIITFLFIKIYYKYITIRLYILNNRSKPQVKSPNINYSLSLTKVFTHLQYIIGSPPLTPPDPQLSSYPNPHKYPFSPSNFCDVLKVLRHFTLQDLH